MIPAMKLSPRFARAALRTVWIFCAALPAAFAAPPSAPPRAEPPSILEAAGAANQSRGMSTVGLTTSMEVLNDKTKLGIGDHVSFRIVEDRHEPIRLFVTDSGEMEIPLIGRVEARGKTCKQLAYEIKPLFEKEYFKKATVIIGLDLVSTKPLGKVFITGQVRSGGLMELMPGEPVTVSQAILRAGGVGDFADKRKIRLVRKKDGVAAMTPEALKALQAKKPGFFKSMFTKNKESATDSTVTYLVDLVEILEKGHLERDPELKVGDLIFVPERLINF
jgi:protein involved in polysaccharide export with SLBB domain